MSEPASWRKKSYYGPRVLIETERILDTPFKDIIICLTGAQVEMLRNVVAYLRRRSTFAQGYTKQYYLAPDNADWETIQTMVSNLEGALMSDLCESILEQLEAHNAILAAMQECLCAMPRWLQSIASQLPLLDGYVTNEDVTYESPGETMGGFTPAVTDALRCENAQAIYQYCYELYAEKLLPFANSTADTLTAIIVASTAFSTLALWVGVPVLILSSIVLAVIAWAIDGSISEFITWMIGHKNEIVCILYNNLPDVAVAAAEMADYIDADEELSLLDKVVLKSVLASSWHFTWIIFEQTENDTWGDYMTVGYCDECIVEGDRCESTVPCDLDDWNRQNPATLVCEGGYPQIKGGWNRFSAATEVTTASPTYIKIWWIPRSPEAEVAGADFDVFLMPAETHKPLYPTDAKPIDVLTSDVYSFTCGIGEIVELSCLQTNWYFDMVGYCLYDSDPDA